MKFGETTQAEVDEAFEMTAKLLIGHDTTKNPNQRKSVKYDINLDNEITEDGAKVAILDKDGKLRMGKGCAEKRGSVEDFLLEREYQMRGDEPEASGGEFALNRPSEEESKTRTIPPLNRSIAPDAKAVVTKQIETQFEPRIAGAPPQDHRGDKTPEFARWLIANRPEQAAKLYAGIWSLNPKFPD